MDEKFQPSCKVYNYTLNFMAISCLALTINTNFSIFCHSNFTPTNAKGNHLYVLTLSLYYKACCVYKVDGVYICHIIEQQYVIQLNTNVPNQLIGIASY